MGGVWDKIREYFNGEFTEIATRDNRILANALAMISWLNGGDSPSDGIVTQAIANIASGNLTKLEKQIVDVLVNVVYDGTPFDDVPISIKSSRFENIKQSAKQCLDYVK